MSRAICCVLRAGGDFGPAHVQWLRRQCAEHMPDWQFICWSDTPVSGVDVIPLKTAWPKWWAKMEIHAPWSIVTNMPALIIDLDTVFLKPLLIKPDDVDCAIFLRDPYRDGIRAPFRLAGGFTYLPARLRRWVWEVWDTVGPDRIMQITCGDDQQFFDGLFRTRDDTRVWQDEYPDHLVSYKAQVRSLGIRPENRVVYFHGKPRPWETSESWVPQLEEIDSART